MKHFADKCAQCQYRGRHIYIVGRLRFARELIVNYIETHTAAKWHQVESLREIPLSNQYVPLGQKMILVDAHMLGREELLQLFQTQDWKAHSHNLLALLNVVHEIEIEKPALGNGARGFLYEDDSAEDLINGICAINSGELWVSRGLLSECLQESYVGKELQQPAGHSMSEREIELLRFLATGATNREIAARLYISPHTVKTHLQHIFHKINVTNRLQAVLWSKKNLYVLSLFFLMLQAFP